MKEKELRLYAANGNIGYGFPEASLKVGMSRKPHMLGGDGGSTDPGPYLLGDGKAFVSREACKRDTKLLLLAARRANIPVIIGTSGGAGGEAGLRWQREIVEEIAKEQNLHFKMAVIHAEQDKDYVKKKLRDGKIYQLGLETGSNFLLTPKTIDETEHIVAMMGIEPFCAALDQKADVIIAGRSTDASIFAALPVKMGWPPGLAWHAGKILECAAASAEPVVAGDSIMVTLRENDFLVEPMNPKLKHTVTSVAAHALYENANPYYLYEPGGMLDISEANYEQYSDRIVRISGSKFVTSKKNRIKLEGVKRVGYRTITIAGTRDPILISQIDSYIKIVRNSIQERLHDVFSGKVIEDDYSLNFKIYGKNGVMGCNEPLDIVAHELGIVIEIIAPTQELSEAICALARTYSLHNDFPGRLSISGNMAVAFSPSDIPMGPAYKFCINHVVEIDDLSEMFPIEMVSM